MQAYKKLFLFGIAASIALAANLLSSNPVFLSSPRTAHAATSTLPYHATANGPYKVVGNMIVGVDGQQYIFHGIGRDGFEYNCLGEGPLDQRSLAFMGSLTGNTISPGAGTYWGANTVRLPLSEGFWLNGAPGSSCTAAQYQGLVKQVVDNLTALHLNVILDLQWSDAGGQSGEGGAPTALPDADSVTFWKQVAPIYQGYSNVLFELFSEPHPAGANTWTCWRSGCQITNDTVTSNDCKCTKTFSYQGVGMQALVDAVRGAGANNLVLVAGVNGGYDLSQLPTNQLQGSNIVYDTHPYPTASKQPSDWDSAFGNLTSTYAIVSEQNGENDCGTSYDSQLLAYFDAHLMSWSAWAWAVPAGSNPCNYPQLATDYLGTPLKQTGQFIYQHLRSYAPYNGPLNKTWYFAEGRVDALFSEFLTLANPDPANDCSATAQYLLDTGTVVSKSFTVPHNSRVTRNVNADLGGQSAAVSIIASVDTSTCNGVVAERPIYYNYAGASSGSSVVGATQLGKTFYFADVATGSGYSSFITILNPPGNQDAHVVATYYLNGNTVGNTQSVTIRPGQRGTIAPGGNGLPTHVGAIVTSDQPIMVERPVYFGNVVVGTAQKVSGGASTVGVQQLSNDWLFAEGFTGAGFQEYLTIANLDTNAKAPADVTIKLEFTDGSIDTHTVTIKPFDQFMFDVSQAAPNRAVSAEITSQGANIVAERQMYFHYKGIQGGNDVIGLPGPVNSTNASYYVFAEGFTSTGFDEWLTLQNPTAIAESVYIYLVNGLGHSYTPGGIVLSPHSRTTVGITGMVSNMIQPGDNLNAYTVSMLIQSAPGTVIVAERPLYFNIPQGARQGGSDVIGYAGG